MAEGPKFETGEIKHFPTEKRLLSGMEENINAALAFLNDHEEAEREKISIAKGSEDRWAIDEADRKEIALDALKDRIREAQEVKRELERLLAESNTDELRAVAKGAIQTLRVLKNAFDNAVTELDIDDESSES